MRAGHETVVWDRDAAAIASPAPDGAAAAYVPRPSRRSAGQSCRLLGHAPGRRPDRNDDRGARPPLGAGAIIIDGGNSFYKDDIRRAKSLAAR